MSCIVWCWWWSRVHKSALDWRGLPGLLHSIDGQCWYFNKLQYFILLWVFGWYFMMPDEDAHGRENVDTALLLSRIYKKLHFEIFSPVWQQVHFRQIWYYSMFFCGRMLMCCQHRCSPLGSERVVRLRSSFNGYLCAQKNTQNLRTYCVRFCTNVELNS